MLRSAPRRDGPTPRRGARELWAGGRNPLSILGASSVAAWYRSDLGITTGTGVSAWADQSGNGRHLLQAAGGAQPALVAGGTPNGRPVLRFDGTDDLLKFADASLVQPCWLLLAVKWTYKASATILVDGTPAGASNQIYNGAGTTTVNLVAGAGISKPGVASATWQVLEFGSNGAASAIAVNGGTQTIGNAGTLAPGGITIGAGTGGALASIADVSEVVVINRAPATAERAALVAYMRGYSGC